MTISVCVSMARIALIGLGAGREARRDHCAVIALETTFSEVVVRIVKNNMGISPTKSERVDRYPPHAVAWPHHRLDRDLCHNQVC